MHPLMPELAGLTDSEIDSKVRELAKKLNQSYRLGNQELAFQVQLIYEGYLEEQSRRTRIEMDKMFADDDDDSLNDLVDVGK